jgi:hypothetical protein
MVCEILIQLISYHEWINISFFKRSEHTILKCSMYELDMLFGTEIMVHIKYNI